LTTQNEIGRKASPATLRSSQKSAWHCASLRGPPWTPSSSWTPSTPSPVRLRGVVVAPMIDLVARICGSNVMGSAMWRRVSLVVTVAQLLLVFACQADDPWEGCTRGTCVCRDFPSCDFICREPGCSVDCAQTSSCGGQCLDRCALTCNDTSSCALSCGDDCAVDCSRASSCNVDCRNGCRVKCSDVSSCNVRLTEGSVVCERAGSCNVHCVPPEGAPVPATHCGGSRFACGPC
jgi:hypothetical protein